MSVFDKVSLTTKRCTLRPWEMGDAPSLPPIANTRDISWNTSYKFPYPYELADAEKFIAHNIKTARLDSWQFAIIHDGKLIGGCGAIRGADTHSHTAIIGYWLGVDSWGQGLATEALEALVRFMRDQTDIEQLTATVYAWNPASGRVLEKCGFNKEGVRRGAVKKWDKTTDLWIYGKLLG